ncbi:Glycine betaine/carnitine/choline-binding protein OpuCC precursor [Paraliobacillus sp. PM-2]|uniref:ABC transporter substrate-binding protein n=1 Tax=Paraliobacillus sp. PM-2 TaxID=1462524 RepID=UPI00061C695B|nr:glycine betaine ABC transporter substrate-binding protein [Paraliobacillus sp. PM-2]CQR46260.1 Glycine betaine/carnitine/choline-binding protein OpuCC precursor [Paraliobacillus sp. PM-2]
MNKTLYTVLFALLLLIITGCGGDNESAEGGRVFEFGTQKNTDPKIMAQIVKQLVEDQTDHEVNITEDIPASPQILGAIEREDFDMALLYSGEVYNNHFDEDKIEYSTDPEKTLTQAQALFGEKYDITWYDSVGFSNQYSIAVQRNFAEENNITTMSDLGEYAQNLTLGTDNSWIERDNDGYEGYKRAYGYDFGEARGMDVALMYEGIASGDLDVITAYTVDPQIIEYDLKLLEDDKKFFPPYEGSLVARNKIIDEYPEIADILDSLVGSISTDEMTALIREVNINERSSEEVAREFLQEKGMVE